MNTKTGVLTIFILILSSLLILNMSTAAKATYNFKLVVDRTPPTVKLKALDYEALPNEIKDKEIDPDGNIYCIGGNCHFVPMAKDNNIITYVNMTVNSGSISKAEDDYSKSKEEIDEKILGATFNDYTGEENSQNDYYYFSREPGSQDSDTLTITASDLAGNTNTTTYTITPKEFYLELQNWGDYNGVRGWGVPFIKTYKICASFIGGGIWHNDPGIIEFGYIDKHGNYKCNVIEEAQQIPDNTNFEYCWSPKSWVNAENVWVNLLRAWAGRRVSSDVYGCVTRVNWKSDDYIDYGGFRVYIPESELKNVKSLTNKDLSIIYFPQSTWKYTTANYNGNIYEDNTHIKVCAEIKDADLEGYDCYQ